MTGRKNTTASMMALLCLHATACGDPAAHGWDDDTRLGHSRAAFVNGSDDRKEYYEISEAELRALVKQSAATIMSSAESDALVSREDGESVDFEDNMDLCSPERFGGQHRAAQCSGVLVERDLVLTAGHCLDFVAESELRVVFGYFNTAPREIDPSNLVVHAVRRVVAAQVMGARSALDYAWLELERPTEPPLRPAAIHVQSSAIVLGDPVFTVGSAWGTPMKLDDGGSVQSVEHGDYFIADTDTTRGWSGGGAFDDSLTLLGTLARGDEDYELSETGCLREASNLEPALADEQYTYAHKAVDGLCATGFSSPLCERRAEAVFTFSDSASCAFSPSGPFGKSNGGSGWVGLYGLAIAVVLRRLRRSGSCEYSTHRDTGASTFSLSSILANNVISRKLRPWTVVQRLRCGLPQSRKR